MFTVYLQGRGPGAVSLAAHNTDSGADRVVLGGETELAVPDLAAAIEHCPLLIAPGVVADVDADELALSGVVVAACACKEPRV